MQVREAIDLANRMKPNQYPDEIMVRWLNECEGLVQVEVMQKQPDYALTRYVLPGDDAEELLVPAPYDKLYWMYLLAMIDFANGEYSNYQNSMQMARDAVKDYHAWWMRNCHKCWQDEQEDAGCGWISE